MVRYPLYKGGFILLPQQVISGLYILDDCKTLSIQEQIQFITVGVKFKTKSSKLNQVRNSFSKKNNIKEPNDIDDIINILLDCSLIKEIDNSYKIDYLQTIEFTQYELDKVMIHLLTDVRQMMNESEEMMSYFKSLDLSNLQLLDSSQSHVLMANEIMDETREQKELLYRTSFVNELTSVKKKVCEVINDEKNN